jgi:hypothetical protein
MNGNKFIIKYGKSLEQMDDGELKMALTQEFYGLNQKIDAVLDTYPDNCEQIRTNKRDLTLVRWGGGVLFTLVVGGIITLVIEGLKHGMFGG